MKIYKYRIVTQWTSSIV